MNEKEKAKELVDRFKAVESLREVTKKHKMYLNIIEAKQCALICVEEVLKTYEEYDENYEPVKTYLKYWQGVKTEIENL